MSKDTLPTPGNIQLPDEHDFHPCRPLSDEQVKVLAENGFDLTELTKATVDANLVYMLPEKLYQAYLE